MRSSNFQIQQSLDPHSNQTNATRTRLQHRLYNHHQSSGEGSHNLTDSINNSSETRNSTGPIDSQNSNRAIIFSAAEQVYKIESNQVNELQAIMEKLQQFNFSLDGECAGSTYNLFNHVNCHTRNSIFSPSSNMSLSLSACNYNHTLGITIMMLEMLENIASTCDTAVTEITSNVISNMGRDSDYTALFYAMVASLTIGALLFVANETHTRYTQEDKEDDVEAIKARSGYRMLPHN